MKCNHNLTHKGVPMGNDQHKVKNEYEALAQGNGGTKRDSQN